MVKTIDNFDLLAEGLFKEPLNGDQFYFLQVLIRAKDGNDVNGNSRNRLVNMYRVLTAEQLLGYRDEIIALCRVNNARAYIYPAKRNIKSVANEAILLAATYTVNCNWSAFRSIYSSACGKTFVAADKKFIIDLDDMQPEDDTFKDIEAFTFKARGHGGANSDKVVLRVPTVSGWHLITKPFDLSGFQQRFPGIQIHKNNPTLLYYEKQ